MPRDTVEELELTSFRSIEGRVLPEAKPVETDSVLRLLVMARAIIADERDWSPCGAVSEGPDGRVQRCTVMACDAAYKAMATHSEVMHAALHWLRAYLPPEPEAADIIAFNDDANTTHADVLALFDRAIARRSEIGA
ncbi:hypothetical protein [Reyranella sp.]|uniref:DUF6197 family protein n=1 Tax=Reyranella sp. TaxID=1929291 RepID=UPI0011FEB998|nr:hypothetical protein [Reyranella sp.]TAJ89699.1 MAG: hypothetical protein EPO50_04870 [Reyranella sp.]